MISALGSSTDRLTGDVLGELGISGDAFLQLMIAQMQNQDPLEPMENEDFMMQLATFSQLEQMVHLNEQVDRMVSFGAMGTIGYTATAYDPFLDITVEGTVTGVKILEDEVWITINNTVDIPFNQVVGVQP